MNDRPNDPDPASIITNGHAPAAISTSPEAEAFAAHLAASVPAFCSPASPHYPAFERTLFEIERDANAGLITFDVYLKRHADAIGLFVLAEFATLVLKEVFDPVLKSAAAMIAKGLPKSLPKKSRTVTPTPRVKSPHARKQRRSGKRPRSR